MSCTCTCSVSPREELEKEACFILGLLAVKPEYQSRIAACGALPGLVRLLKEHKINATPSKGQPGHGAAARRAADAITNLAHENSEIKSMVRERGGIPPLVALLEAMDTKVWRWYGAMMAVDTKRLQKAAQRTFVHATCLLSRGQHCAQVLLVLGTAACGWTLCLLVLRHPPAMYRHAHALSGVGHSRSSEPQQAHCARLPSRTRRTSSR